MLAALGLFVQSSFHLPDDVFANPKGIDALYQVGPCRISLRSFCFGSLRHPLDSKKKT